MPPDTPPALSPSDGPAARRGRRPPGPGARGRPRPRRGGRRRHRGAGEAGAEPDRRPDQRAVPGQRRLRRRRARQDAERPQLPAGRALQDRRRLEPDHPHHRAGRPPAVALQGRARGPHERRPGLRPRRRQPDRLPGDLAAPRPDGRLRPDGDAADRDLEGPGTGKWSAGPAAVAVWMPGRWVIGTLINNQWSSAGDNDRRQVNQMLVQPFVNYNLGKGWYLASSPIITADWEAKQGKNVWTVPVGGGFGRLPRVGKLPVNASVQAFDDVEASEFGTDWTLRLQVQFLFPN